MAAQDGLSFRFRATIIEWRGPAPFFFAPLPQADAARVRAVAKRVSYGWGVIPVQVTIGEVTFTTSLFPRDDTYLLPLKDKVRRPLAITAGDEIDVQMTVGAAKAP
ncbi:MAG: DUF1905 domain-containing protein [Devosia sp.]